ncbi:MAG: hypothetical protein K8R91_01665 [Phycisphaerae bacterium]|nr:hypothetical protein [Phycisphaerae bacterium]
MIGSRTANGNKHRPVFSLLAVSALLGCAVTVAAGAEKAIEPGFEKGMLQELTVPIGRLMKLTFKGNGLQLDRQHWEKDLEGKTKAEVLGILADEIGRGRSHGGDWAKREAKRLLDMQPADRAFKRLQFVVHNSGSSGSGSSGSGRRYQSFSGSDFKGRIDLAGKSVCVTLEEMNSPGRKLEILDDGWGVLRITISDSSGKFLLVAGQGEKGRFSIAHIAGDKVFAATSETFGDFYTEHLRYVDGRFFAVLKHMGVVVPWGRYNPKVKETVLAGIIGPLSAEQTERGKELISQLDDNSFEQREEAMGVLTAQFARYRNLIEQAAKDASNSPEVASRLKKIVKANTGQDDIGKFVTGQKLTTDVGYLIWLIGESHEDDRAAVIGILKRLTQQEFGSDADAWKKWWSQKQADESAATKPK